MGERKWGWQYDRPEEPSPDFARALENLGRERSDRGTWLVAYYEPGYVGQPVERWVVAEVVPKAPIANEADFYLRMGDRAAAEASEYAQLTGPSPLEGAYLGWKTEEDAKAGKPKRLIHPKVQDGTILPYTITYRQWVLFKELGGKANPFWIVQGESGGHPIRYNAYQEAKLRLAAERDAWRGMKARRIWETPSAGELPYAPPDMRVIEAIARAKEMAAYEKSVRDNWKAQVYADREFSLAEGDEQATLNDAERELAREYDAWLEDTVDNRRALVRSA